jgi:hypothetical protein
MIIHIRGDEALDTGAMLARLVERQRGRELRLGRRIIGWNLDDTIVVRSEGIALAQLQRYVRHFAPQRHVVFDHRFPAAAADQYFAFARELHDYVFAFMKTPSAECLGLQNQLKAQAKHAGWEVVTLNPDRSIQQLEVLLMSAAPAIGTEDPLTLPEAPARRVAARRTPRKTAAAA